MRYGFLLLASTAILLSACADHSKTWDDAFGDCQAQAIKQSEYAGVQDDQRAGWISNYINTCMQKKGAKP
jgi:hypothetical protein